MRSVCHCPSYTLRTVDGPSGIKEDAWDAVKEAIEYGIAKLDIPMHVFVTIVGASGFYFDSENGGCAIYHAGIQHIAIAAGDEPDYPKFTREQWLNEIQVATIHELVHLKQDLEGTLQQSDHNEELTEATAQRLVDELQSRKS